MVLLVVVLLPGVSLGPVGGLVLFGGDEHARRGVDARHEPVFHVEDLFVFVVVLVETLEHGRAFGVAVAAWGEEVGDP